MEHQSTNIDSISLINNIQIPSKQLYSFTKFYNIHYDFKEENHQYIYNFYIRDKFLFLYKSGRTPQGEDYSIIETNGLKTYDEEIDTLRTEYLYKFLSYVHLLNENIGKWNLRRVDVAIDIKESMSKILIHKRGKSTKQEESIEENGYYRVEEIPKSGTKSMSTKAVLYNKINKEICFHNNIIDEDVLTRFEVSLLPKVMKKIKNPYEMNTFLEKYKMYKYETEQECIKDKKRLNEYILKKKSARFKSKGKLISFEIASVTSFLDEIARFISLKLN